MVAAHRPDVLVLDLNMPGPASLPAIPELAQRTAVVVLTMQSEPAFAREALQAGARGYVLKESRRRRARPGGARGGGRAGRTSTPSSAPGWPPRRPRRGRPTT